MQFAAWKSMKRLNNEGIQNAEGFGVGKKTSGKSFDRNPESALHGFSHSSKTCVWCWCSVTARDKQKENGQIKTKQSANLTKATDSSSLILKPAIKNRKWLFEWSLNQCFAQPHHWVRSCVLAQHGTFCRCEWVKEWNKQMDNTVEGPIPTWSPLS